MGLKCAMSGWVMLPKTKSDKADHIVLIPSQFDYCSEIED